MAAVDYDIEFSVPYGAQALIEYQVMGTDVWTTPSSPVNPTTSSPYVLTLDDGTDYYVRVTSVSPTCTKKSVIIVIYAGSTTTTTTTTSTTSSGPTCESYTIKHATENIDPQTFSWTDCDGNAQSTILEYGESVDICSLTAPSPGSIYPFQITDNGLCTGSLTENYKLDASYYLSIDLVTGIGVPSVPATGANGKKYGHHTAMSGTYYVHISGTVSTTLKMDITVAGVLSSCVAITAAGIYPVTISALETDNVIIAIDSGPC